MKIPFAKKKKKYMWFLTTDKLLGLIHNKKNVNQSCTVIPFLTY